MTPATDPNPTAPAGLSDEAVARMAARASDIINGRIPPEPLPTPDEVARYWEFLLRPPTPAPTPAATLFQLNWLNLMWHHGGEEVVTFTNADGVQSVLAVGAAEADALYPALDDHDNARARTQFPPPWA